MRKLLNTLYVTNPDIYLRRDGLNVIIDINGNKKGFPIHNFENIIIFQYTGISPALMQLCMEHNINVCFLSPYGKLQGKLSGPIKGNVLLRKEQYRISDDEDRSINYAKNFILGKIYNQKFRLSRGLRDHSEKIDRTVLERAIKKMDFDLSRVKEIENNESLLGLEGNNAREYFSGLKELIISNKEDFDFVERTRRPALDPTNSMLSFGYSLLASLTQGALETVGLDPYVGFYHKDRPGRASLALDLMEELRSYLVDSFVVTLINRKQMKQSDFWVKEDGAYLFTDDARMKFIKEWQTRLSNKIEHPFLEEQIEIGLIPYVQALLLARTVRGDLEMYPPFFCK